jgi:hypothetical protein
MALADIIRSGVALAHQITNDGKLQEEVTLERWTGQTDTGAPTFAGALKLRAVVERGDVNLRDSQGETITASLRVTFVAPFAGLTAEGRREPVDPRDRLTLADGVTGPILRVDGGVNDAATNRPFVTEVWMK